MLYNIKNLIDNKIQAIDGEIGKLYDFYFDDRSWTIRYLIIDTAKWIEGKKVLLSPVVIQKPDFTNKHMLINLTKDQIKNSPDIDTEKPVYKQQELDSYWPVYGTSGLTSPFYANVFSSEKDQSLIKNSDDPHLRSAEEIRGYYIGALDGEIGHVDDMIIDEDSWNIHFLIIKTANWFPGKKVLISPSWINLISWEDQKVFVDMTVESIKNSPEFDSTKPLELSYETELNNYYGKES